MLLPAAILWSGTLQAQCDNRQASALYDSAGKAYGQRQFEKALEALNRCLYTDATCAEAYLLRASVWEQLGRPENALTDIRTARALQPLSREVAFRQAVTLYQLSRWQEALDGFKEILSLPAGETRNIFYVTEPYRNTAVGIVTLQSNIEPTVYNYMGLAAIRLQHCPEAIAYLDTALSLQGRNPNLLVHRALACMACNQPDQARANLEEALHRQPDHALALYHLALLQAGSHDEEWRYTQAIMADSLQPDLWLKRAHYRLQHEDYAGAEHDYTRALALLPHDPEIWLNRGMAREYLRNCAGAYDDYSKALALQEDLLKAWLHRGNVLMQMKQYERAIDDYTAAMVYDPRYGKAWFNRGMAYHYLKHAAQACRDFLKAKELGVDIPAALLNACVER